MCKCFKSDSKSTAEIRNKIRTLVRPSQILNISSRMADLSGMRKAYNDKRTVLERKDLLADPFEMFHKWFQYAKENAQPSTESNAVCLATVSKDGKPSSRMVLLKGYSKDDGFLIYTNYESRKGTEMQENPNVALLFYWDYQMRQIRIEGRVQKVSEEKSTEYFNSRPRDSQLAARVSQQSRPIESREAMNKRFEAERQQWEGTEKIPKPKYWGGFSIIPERYEFWQGQSDRLHDRFVYTKVGNNEWNCQRLQP